ncbi:unnamed protein product [Tuber melanosporum]|uniref:(Perigord truffle) hypothetical protein n=1 Tax=Tuber melanosporum (strain Mel28) TaxID=656061 RepID=D5GN92_TUBMM|nr:uncharacterized protein GSTUM_00011163001 [Tuber melanosporum]CAZ85985.1 unnamed protein product [Tuber melanosporum]
MPKCIASYVYSYTHLASRNFLYKTLQPCNQHYRTLLYSLSLCNPLDGILNFSSLYIWRAAVQGRFFRIVLEYDFMYSFKNPTPSILFTFIRFPPPPP